MKKLISTALIMIIILNLMSIYMPQTSYALSNSYTQTLKVGIENFPESYKSYLQKLKEYYPNWTFKAYYTGIDWNELTSSAAENACMKNTIYRTPLMDPNILCICGRIGDKNYYCASAKTVNYYLDPRNSLSESSIYQFLDLSNSINVSRETISKIVNGTYLEKYVDTIIEAASKTGVSPIHIIVTIFQELGKKAELPRGISGTVQGHEGFYNFYNYGATDGDGAVERGLDRAKELGWTTPEFALIDGAEKVLKAGYISAGQVTKYFYKFDVVGDSILKDNETKTYSSGLFFNHQYMTNIQDPTSQSAMLMEYYTNNGLADSNLNFVIPIYNNMPSSPAEFPTSLTSNDGELYTIDTVHVSSLTARDAAGNSIGTFTKNQIVAVQSINGNKATIKLKVATNLENKKWNYEEKTVYLNDASYLVKKQNNITPAPEPVVEPVQESADLKVEETEIKMTPATKVSDLLEKLPNAKIFKTDDTEITDASTRIGTGYKIKVDGKEYIAIKYGDCSGDGKIDAMDMYQLIQYLLEKLNLEDYRLVAVDVNKDSKIDAMDMYKIIQHLLEKERIKL